MSSNTDRMTESIVARRLEELKAVPARDPSRAASGRARFLHEAAQHRHTVLPGAQRSGWIFPFRTQKFVMNALVVLVLAAALLLGGGATIAAAQDDLPTESLYPLKLWTEDAALALNSDPQEQAGLLMNMAQTRVEEIAALTETGITPPDQVRERLETHLRQTLVLAADMDESSRDQVLQQLRGRLLAQDRILEQLQAHAGPETEPLLTRTRQMLQSELYLVDQGITDPQSFRSKVKNPVQPGLDEEVGPDPNPQGDPGSHQGAQPTGRPGNGNGNEPPGGPNSDHPQNGNGGNGSGNRSPGGQNSHNPENGNCSGASCDQGNGGGGNR